MKVIYKYILKPESKQILRLPKGAIVLHVDIQYIDQLTIWCEVDTKQPKEDRHFEIIGTGQEIEDLHPNWFRLFIGTVMPKEYVWHIYETVNSKSI